MKVTQWLTCCSGKSCSDQNEWLFHISECIPVSLKPMCLQSGNSFIKSYQMSFSIDPSGFSPKVASFLLVPFFGRMASKFDLWLHDSWSALSLHSGRTAMLKGSENIPLWLMQNTFKLMFHLLKWVLSVLAEFSAYLIRLIFFLNLTWEDHPNLTAVLSQWIKCNEEIQKQ